MDNNIRITHLELLNQKIEIAQKGFRNYGLTWQGKESDFAKSEFITDGKFKFGHYYEGAWAWYKILGLDTIQKAKLVSKLQNNILESPLGNFTFSIIFNKGLYLFSSNGSDIPEQVVEVADVEDFYD